MLPVKIMAIDIRQPGEIMPEQGRLHAAKMMQDLLTMAASRCIQPAEDVRCNCMQQVFVSVGPNCGNYEDVCGV